MSSQMPSSPSANLLVGHANVGIGSGALTPSPLATQYPHLSHYIASLLQIALQENLNHQASNKDTSTSSETTANHGSHKSSKHPLSVSSASSDVLDDDEDIPQQHKDHRANSSSTSSPPSISHSEPDDERDATAPLKLEIPGHNGSTASSTQSVVPSAQREEMIRKVIDLLGNEKEEEVKEVVKERLGVLANDESYVDQVCLDLMHKHKDDMDSVPYTPFTVTPIRPKASPIPAHAQPFRPFTPSRVPSYRARTPMGRPQSPAAGLGAGIIGSGSPKLTRTVSGQSGGVPPALGASSVLGAAGYGSASGFNSAISPMASPASSPKLGHRSLNFGQPNQGSGAYTPGGSLSGGNHGANGNHGMSLNFGAPGSGTVTPTGTGSKLGSHLAMPYNAGGVDPWASAFGKIASPLGTPPIMSRSSSFTGLPQAAYKQAAENGNPDGGYPFPGGVMPRSIGPTSSSGDSTGQHPTDHDDQGVDDLFSTSAMNRHKHMLPDDDDDEFSPFGNDDFQNGEPKDRGSPITKLLATAKAFDPTKLGPPGAGFNPGHGPQALGGSFFGGGGERTSEYGGNYGRDEELPSGMLTPGGSAGPGPDDPNYLGEGMTPLDVLQSVFTSLPIGDLEEALHKTGYNFEEAMALLISQNGGTRSGNSGTFTPSREDGLNQQLGNRPNVFAPGGPASRNRDIGPGGYYQSGGRGAYGMGGPGNASPRFGMGGGSGARTPGGLKMCRYYLAGECRRSDCRFSHDVDRALCRFWLRGQCAKGDQCEFIHALPSVDPNMLTNAMSRIELSHDGTSRSRSRPDEFPDLHLSANQRGPVFDPSRNRFANAVKRPVGGPGPQYTHIGGQRSGPVIPPSHRPFSAGPGFRRRPDGPGPSGPPMPHPSPRIKLRPPTLMPTLPTGAAMNDMYMEARQAAIKLGQSRNACLARAAEAWRRGDGATAKRFSREANVLNERMTVETADAAANLVRQRRTQAQEAIRARGEWSSDPEDRPSRGKECAGGLGVVMGVAGANILGPASEALTTSERTEVLLDLHMLHANEASDVLEDFLMALERENFHGLAYIVVGDERHVGTQDTGRGASRHRLASGIKMFLQRYGYPWSEGGGSICIDPLTHS